MLKHNIKESIDTRRIHHQLMPMQVSYEVDTDPVKQFIFPFFQFSFHFLFLLFESFFLDDPIFFQFTDYLERIRRKRS